MPVGRTAGDQPQGRCAPGEAGPYARELPAEAVPAKDARDAGHGVFHRGLAGRQVLHQQFAIAPIVAALARTLLDPSPRQSGTNTAMSRVATASANGRKCRAGMPMPPSHRLARGSRGRRACSRKRWPSCATTGSSSATVIVPRRNDRGRDVAAARSITGGEGAMHNPCGDAGRLEVSPSASRAAMADASVQPVPCASMARRGWRISATPRASAKTSTTTSPPEMAALEQDRLRPEFAQAARWRDASLPRRRWIRRAATPLPAGWACDGGQGQQLRPQARRAPAASHRRSPPSLDRERPVHRRALRAFRQRLRSRQLLRASRALRRGCRSRRSTLRPAPAGTPCPARAPR